MFLKWWYYLDSIKLQENKASSCPRGTKAGSEMKMGYKSVSWSPKFNHACPLGRCPLWSQGQWRRAGGWNTHIVLVTISQINFLWCTGRENPKRGRHPVPGADWERNNVVAHPLTLCLWVSQTLQGCSVQSPVTLHQCGLKGTQPTALTGKNDQSHFN